MFYDYYVHVITKWVYLPKNNNRKRVVVKAINALHDYYNRVDDENTSHEFVIVAEGKKTERL